jgi:hypothetical protein
MSSPCTEGEAECVLPLKINNDIDILFMIDSSSSMTSMQTKLLQQLPTFMQVLQALPMGLPSIHVAVVSSDMGAPSDQSIGCTNRGDNGKFYVKPESPCTSAGFTDPNALYISDSGSDPTLKNFTAADPAGISTVFTCIAALGSNGCGFEHQLASIDRALGADGQGAGASPDFLRPDAYLGIVMLTNEDDCSAPASATPLPVYSLNGDGVNDINTPAFPGGPADGPIAKYRCNGGPLGGHLCQDLNPGSTNTSLTQPPLVPPADATGNPSTLPLSNCISNETPSSALTPVSKFVADIKSLKADPANQILVAAVTGVNGTGPNATPLPYVVEWLPGTGSASDQLWPQVEHVCVSGNGDGSFADPAVRITQFVHAFGVNGFLASICDNSYEGSLSAIAQKIGDLIGPKCVAGVIQQDANGQPDCSVIAEVTNMGVTEDLAVAACTANGGAAPCWRLVPSDATNNCPADTQALAVSPDPNNPNSASVENVIRCSTCVAGVRAPGCPCLGNGTDVVGCV